METKYFDGHKISDAVAKPNSNNDVVISFCISCEQIKDECICICVFCEEIKSGCICKCFCNANPCYCEDFIANVNHEISAKSEEIKDKKEYYCADLKTVVKFEEIICKHCNLIVSICNCKCSVCGKSSKEMRNWGGILFCEDPCFRDLCLICMKTPCVCKCFICGNNKNIRKSEGKAFCPTCIRCCICKIGDRKTNNGEWIHYNKGDFVCGNCAT